MYPLFDMLKTPYIERFAATGIKPEEVDYVFCTHLHHDHCGWSTQLRDGKFVPTFPNARYVYVRREYARWDSRPPDHKSVDYNIGVFERSVLPIMEAGLADLVDERHRISDSVAIEPAYGHTLGHSMLHLCSQTSQAYFTGDVFHHPLQIPYPELHLPGCDDLAMAIETRKRVAALCAERNALMIPAHFAKPHAGHVRNENGSFVFDALSPCQ
jgi:glyoxylase-like metal-dependent hydrolase (beta-lactamase superfamily II)